MWRKWPCSTMTATMSCCFPLPITSIPARAGTHEDGFKQALTRVLNAYARKNNLLKDSDKNLSGEDCREGLTAIISVKLREPQFEGQTKGKLGNTEMRQVVSAIVTDKLTTYFEENPQVARTIIERPLPPAARPKPPARRRSHPAQISAGGAWACPAS